MRKWYVIGLVLQCSHVVAAEFIPAVGMAAGILGVGIPLVIGFLWAKSDSVKEAPLGQAFLLGFVPALIGLVLAFGLGHLVAFVVGAGSISSGVAGVIGAVVGKKASG